MSDKLSKSVVLYFPPALIGQNEGARCGKCIMFVRTGHCTAVAGSIDGEHGVCGLYVHGRTSGSDVQGMIPKHAAGYTEEGPTHCGNCEYYGGGIKPDGPCRKVEGEVAYNGCCNFWSNK
jgi:hypothetical protein